MPRTASTLLLSIALIAAAATAQAPHDPVATGHRHGAAVAGEETGAESPPEAHSGLRHEGSADHSFADAEDWAERFESAERDAWQMPDKVIEALALEPGASVADIGSGTGYFARRFAEAVGPAGTVYAADVEPAMAEYARRRADEDGQRNLVPVLASYDDPRLPDGTPRPDLHLQHLAPHPGPGRLRAATGGRPGGGRPSGDRRLPARRAAGRAGTGAQAERRRGHRGVSPGGLPAGRQPRLPALPVRPRLHRARSPAIGGRCPQEGHGAHRYGGPTRSSPSASSRATSSGGSGLPK